MNRTSQKSRRHGIRRRAYILVVILGFTAVVITLGASFLESNATAMPEARNRLHAARAQYLAESGINLAEHYLLYPPTTVAAGNYWTGTNGIAIDTTNDYANVTVAQDATYKDQYLITAVGVAKDFDGSVKGKRSIQAKVIAQPPKWVIPYGVIKTSSNMFVPRGVKVYGNVHCNYGLTSSTLAWCNGKVSATNTAVWSGLGPPTSVSSSKPAFVTPVINSSYYSSYQIDGTTYTAVSFTASDFRKSDADALNAQSMSTNPGRIIICSGNSELKLKKDVSLNGTLFVQGNLKMDDDGARSITAVNDFPALVVTGNIYVGHDDANLTVNGSILCGGQLQDNDRNRVVMNVTGASIFANGFNLQKTDGNYTFTWNQSRATFWRLENKPRRPITVLSWKDN